MTKYTLDDKNVNASTFFISLFLRAAVFFFGLALISAGTSLSFGKLFIVSAGVLLIWGSKTIVLTFTD